MRKLIVAGLACALLFLNLVLSRPSAWAREKSVPFRFQPYVISVGRGPSSNVVADVNHDGRPDILVANTADQTLTVLLGNGKGHFHPLADSIRTGPQPNDLAVSDFNGDGNLDIAISNHSTPYITLLLGDGKGGFRPAPHSPFATQAHPHVHGVIAADFNGDGKPDVVTESWENDQILMLAGDGNGNLVLPGRLFQTGKRPYQRLRSADFNKDGFADIVTTDLGAC